MQKTEFVAIGNAIVDLTSSVDDQRLAELNVQKGIMQLVDDKRSQALFEQMPNHVRTAGGSAANSAIVASRMGLSTTYVSKVGNDVLGDFYASSMENDGVIFDTKRDFTNVTGRSMIFITPDGERSMNTYLGASEFLSEEDIDFDAIESARYLYLEGYRFDGPESQSAFHKAVKASKKNGGIASITLSDPFCVERHKSAFHDLIESGIDIVFCNEHELMAYSGARDFIAACESMRQSNVTFVTTAGAAGAYVISEGEITHVPTRSVEVKDATGAGDYFAGGFLAALSKGLPYSEAAAVGCRAAGEIVQVVGTRVTTDLRAILEMT